MTKSEKNKIAKVGIFMPSYNLGKYIDEALETLDAQTFQDFIVIIADDASTSKESIEKLKTIKRPHTQVFFEKKNLGLVGMCNKYMQRLDAEYITLFSPDDKLHPDFLKEQVAYLDSHPEVHAVGTWIQEFGAGDSLKKYSDELSTLPHMLIDNHFSGAALMRKSAWLAAGMHDTDKDLYPNQDYQMWLSMLEKGYVLKTIPKALFFWRIIPESMSHSVNMEQVHTFRKTILKKYAHLYKKYSSFVLGEYLEKIHKLEEYYQTSEEGHAWLDAQYHSLIKQNEELQAQLKNSIPRPTVRRVADKALRVLKIRK